MFINQLKPKLLLLCLLLGATALGQAPAQGTKPRNCSLSGRVTIDGKAAVNASITVMLAEAENPQAVSAGQAEKFYAKAVTDDAGRYQFFNLPAGRLWVRALSKAYVSKAQLESVLYSEEQMRGGKTVTLVAGEQRADCDFEVVRGGVITGRVTEEGGKPVVNERLNLIALDQENRLRPHTFFGTTEAQQFTDDRGVYRLYGLPAGRYLIFLGAGRIKQGDYDQSFSGSRYRLMFYPDAEGPDKAKAIEIKEGSEVTDVDLKLTRIKEGSTFAASGRVLDAETGDPIPHAGLSLDRRSDDVGESWWQSYADARGNFRIEGLKSGQYTLVYDPFFGMEREQQPNSYADRVKFEVAEEEVKGLEVRLQRGAIISGVVVVEGEGIVAEPPLTISKTPVWEELTEQQQAEQGEAQQESATSKVGPGGEFRLTGVRPGRFTLWLMEDGHTFRQIKLLRVERNGVNLGTRLAIGSREQLTGLRVVAQRATGSLRGQVKFSGGSLPPGFVMGVSVVSEEILRRQESGERAGIHGFDPELGQATVDEAGNFLIGPLIPGSYKLWLNVYPIKGGKFEPPFEQITQRVSVNAQGETAVTITVELGKKQ